MDKALLTAGVIIMAIGFGGMICLSAYELYRIAKRK